MTQCERVFRYAARKKCYVTLLSSLAANRDEGFTPLSLGTFFFRSTEGKKNHNRKRD